MSLGINTIESQMRCAESKIYYWDKSFKKNHFPSYPIIISDTESDCSSPEMSGNSVVWLGKNNGNATIYYLDLSLIT